MFFTAEEVTRRLVGSEGRWFSRPDEAARFEQSNNYQTILRYLTGEINTLNALQQDEFLYYYQPLAKMIGNYVQPDARDTRLLNTLQHPVLHNHTNYAVLIELLRRIKSANSDELIKGLLLQLQQRGVSADEVFMGLITQNDAIASAEGQANEDSPYGRFLRSQFIVSHFPQRRSTVFNYGRNGWSPIYFFLLERTDQQRALRYLADNIFDPYSNALDFAVQAREGALIKRLLAALSGMPEPDIAHVQIKMMVLAWVFDEDPSHYRAQMEGYARTILEYRASQKSIPRYERGMYIHPRAEKPGPRVEFTAAALYYLLRIDQAKALAALDSLLEKRIELSEKVFYMVYLVLGDSACSWYGKALEKSPKGTDLSFYEAMIDRMKANFKAGEYLPYLWSIAGTTLRTVKVKLALIFTEKDPQAEEKAIQLLGEKNADKRQTAALVLQQLASPGAKAAIAKLLDTESNDTARDILLQSMENELPSDLHQVQYMIEAAAARGKLKKPVESWLTEEDLPTLYLQTGEALSLNERRFLLYRMSRVKEMRSDPEARCLLRHIDRRTSGPFATKLIQLFTDNGGKPDQKWLMALAALLGNDEIVDKLKSSINSWVEGSRYKMAEYGVGALALQGSDKALRWVEWYSRKYRTKKANVGAAAMQALENAADELGITPHELGDRIVPDFGFDGLFKTFTADAAEYRAFIDSKFKIAFFNDDNKKLKSIPASADESTKEAFKAIAKEIKDIVKSQSPRLEYYLIIQRRWTWPQWQQFFLNNPVMFIYATRLVWGIYNNDGELQSAFLCNDDTSLINSAQEEIDAPVNAMIGMLHPAQLDEAALKQWQQLQFDMGIEPVFPQLDRTVPSLEGYDLSRPIITQFMGKRMATGFIRSTLERYGWNKGATGDGGFIDSMNLLYFEKQLEAILELEGVGAGFGWSDEERLGRLYFIDRKKVTNKWSVYARDENDPKLIPASQVPAIFLNETIAAIEKIKPYVEKRPEE